MNLRARRSGLVMAVAIAATVAVGLVGTGGRASAAASRAGHAESWTYAFSEGPLGFDAWTCEVGEWCVATPYTLNGFIAWDVSLEGRLALVTNADISSNVPNGICCGPFSMDTYTNNYVWDGSGVSQGDMAPNSQPNAREDCTGGGDDALSCVSRYWGWLISWEAGSIEFDHSNFVNTNDDRGTVAGFDECAYHLTEATFASNPEIIRGYQDALTIAAVRRHVMEGLPASSKRAAAAQQAAVASYEQQLWTSGQVHVYLPAT